jgi:excinuclease UvrABC ATPase subunit
MKGVRRNELNPFLRRLAREGLWELKVPFEELDRDKRDIVLFGFWSRPGAGSFLKNSRANPAEVASWLRWDGLYRQVHDQADRSHDVEWLRRVREGARVKTCLLCGGSGMRQFAKLLEVGGTAFSEWVGLSNSVRMVEQLRKVEVSTPRQRRTRERILYCLAPLAKAHPSAAPVVERSVESFTTMATAHCTDIGGS